MSASSMPRLTPQAASSKAPLTFAFRRVLTVTARELAKPHLKDRTRVLIACFSLIGLGPMLITGMTTRRSTLKRTSHLPHRST